MIKRLDELWGHKIKPGFEMLVNNFSAGISPRSWRSGHVPARPVLRAVMEGLGNAVEFLVDHGLLPFTAIVIEPAKVLFLNNAINHGVLTPLGLDQSKQLGHRRCSCSRPTPAPGSAC